MSERGIEGECEGGSESVSVREVVSVSVSVRKVLRG